MIKHLLAVLAPYVLPLLLTGIGIMIPDDTSLKTCIAYSCFIAAGLIFGWAAFKDIKSYLQKRKDIKTEKEKPLPQKLREYDILDDCIWEENPGWFRNPTTDEKFCSNCWDVHKTKKHLTKINLSQWICPKCNKSIDSRLNMWKDLFMKKPPASIIGREFKKQE
jgi:hypothetical protein